MAHEVTIEIPSTRTVLHKDIRIEVRDDEGKLGTLLVSKGNIEWLPSPKSVKKHRLTWRQFAKLMADAGKVARTPKRPKAKPTSETEA